MAQFIPVKGVPSVEQTAELMVREVFRPNEIPEDVVSNTGVQL